MSLRQVEGRTSSWCDAKIRFLIRLWLCLLYAAVRLSQIRIPQSLSVFPALLLYRSTPILPPTLLHSTPPQMVVSASPHQSPSCLHLIFVVSVLNPCILVI